MTDAEIAGFMNWRGPGAYTAHAMRRVKAAINEAVKRERVACAISCEVNAARWIDEGKKNSAAHECAESIRARGEFGVTA